MILPPKQNPSQMSIVTVGGSHYIEVRWESLPFRAGRRFTPVGEGGSGRRPLPPQSLNILVGLTLKLLSLYGIVVLVGNNWTVGCFINNLVA